MIRMDLRVELDYEIAPPSADFIFNIQVARTPRQTIIAERLTLNQPVAQRVHTDLASANRYLYVHALPGELKLVYSATVDLAHHFAEPAEIAEIPVSDLPPDAIGYIYPSRYCQSDLLTKLASGEFGNLPRGYGRVQAIQRWVQSQVKFTSNSSNSNTSAIETLAQHVGVCRDFAHLMIALCRAVNIPARFASGTDYGADPALGLPDFQAYVEVFLGDRWYIFDPSGTAIPMGFVRFGTGRDAADVSFATIFGSVRSRAPVIRAVAVNDPAHGMVFPSLCHAALSTDGVRDDALSREPVSSPGNTGDSNTR